MVHLSRTAVSRRIAALKRDNILQDAAEVLNYESLGFRVRALVQISAPSHAADKLRQTLVHEPEVLSVAVIAGDGILCVDVVAIDTDHLHRFVNGLQKIGETSTRIIYASHKSELTLVDRMRLLRERTVDGVASA